MLPASSTRAIGPGDLDVQPRVPLLVVALLGVGLAVSAPSSGSALPSGELGLALAGEAGPWGYQALLQGWQRLLGTTTRTLPLLGLAGWGVAASIGLRLARGHALWATGALFFGLLSPLGLLALRSPDGAGVGLLVGLLPLPLLLGGAPLGGFRLFAQLVLLGMVTAIHPLLGVAGVAATVVRLAPWRGTHVWQAGLALVPLLAALPGGLALGGPGPRIVGSPLLAAFGHLWPAWIAGIALAGVGVALLVRPGLSSSSLDRAGLRLRLHPPTPQSPAYTLLGALLILQVAQPGVDLVLLGPVLVLLPVCALLPFGGSTLLGHRSAGACFSLVALCATAVLGLRLPVPAALPSPLAEQPTAMSLLQAVDREAFATETVIWVGESEVLPPALVGGWTKDQRPDRSVAWGEAAARRVLADDRADLSTVILLSGDGEDAHQSEFRADLAEAGFRVVAQSELTEPPLKLRVLRTRAGYALADARIDEATDTKGPTRVGIANPAGDKNPDPMQSKGPRVP